MKSCGRCGCVIFPGETQCPDCHARLKEPSRDKVITDIDNLIKDLHKFREEMQNEVN